MTRSVIGGSFKFFDRQGMLYHGAAIAYAVVGYAFGIAGLFVESLMVNALATLLLSHAMIIAAYLVHECGHNTIFQANPDNARIGRVMSWVCGSAYGTFEDMRFKHFRHHVDNGDLVWFDYERWFARHPVVLKVTQRLEWCYIPAHEIIMHGGMALTSFVIPKRRDQRRRNVSVMIVRFGLYLLLLVFAPKAALLYLLATLATLIVLRFMDSLQHDYGGTPTLFDPAPGPHKGDLVWEQAHTFSNPLSLRYEALNWLVLNFGYHNAHHAKPTVPWFRLPALHREMFGNDPQTVIPLKAQLKIYHRGRVARIHKWEDEQNDVAYPVGSDFLLAAQRAEVPGGNAASFLISF